MVEVDVEHRITVVGDDEHRQAARDPKTVGQGVGYRGLGVLGFDPAAEALAPRRVNVAQTGDQADREREHAQCGADARSHGEGAEVPDYPKPESPS